MFRIPAGTKCLIRRPGSEEWQPFTTTKPLTFLARTVADNGGRWQFTRPDGWALKVATCYVQGREPAERRGGTFNAGILGKNGRGANRRRNRRRS